jgi:hypothetical protein
MVLHAENRQLPVLDAFDGAIIEVKVRHLKFLATWHVLTASSDCKSVILGCDQDVTVRQIPHGVIPPAVTVRELLGASAEREPDELVTEANAKHRCPGFRDLADLRQHVLHGCGVSRPVGQEDAVRPEFPDPSGGS